MLFLRAFTCWRQMALWYFIIIPISLAACMFHETRL
jgi:hypothetical protein